jgi:pyruvate kinase
MLEYMLINLTNIYFMEKRTKIVCTIGPSSWDVPVLKKLIKAGMNVFRLNCAFLKDAKKEIPWYANQLRQVSKDVALMLDIKGNDVRLNNFEEPITLKKNMELVIGSKEQDPIHPANHLELYKDLKKGNLVFFDDGSVKAEVSKIQNKKIYLKILAGEILNPGKSLNTPGVYLSLPAVTAKDGEQIKIAIEDDWDFIAASYVRSKEDALEIKKHVKGSDIQIIAKIEEGMGISNIDGILEVMDGVMIGRGDMGVELPYEQIPVIQKMIIQKCNQLGKPVITATQVMESMKSNSSPTRAEISDAANAIWDGSDSIMTSGETTSGKYPVETVEAIARIADEIENYLEPRIIPDEYVSKENQVSVAVSHAAFDVALNMNVDAVLISSKTGRFARFMARYDLPMPLYTFVTRPTYKRQLSLTKGVEAFLIPPGCNTRECSIKKIIEFALENKLINKRSKVLIIGSVLQTELEFPNIFEYVDVSKLRN